MVTPIAGLGGKPEPPGGSRALTHPPRRIPSPTGRRVRGERRRGVDTEIWAMALWQKIQSTLPWLPGYLWQRMARRTAVRSPVHLIIALADHFEPTYVPYPWGGFADRDVQERRLERWCREYPTLVRDWRDRDGFPFRHTYFYPAEAYDKDFLNRLAEHCHAGWGEVEIHLHHGLKRPDNSENTRRQLEEFRDALVKHGCLSRWDGAGLARYAFVHGNWALANSARGRFCGVDDEMLILAETGCYAEVTLPSAPSLAQISKINALYECSLPLGEQAPHRRGRDLTSGRVPTTFPLIVQGPLLLDFGRRICGWPVPRIENSEISAAHPPTMERLRLWRQAGITVEGRPNWVFIKLHCHGISPQDNEAMLGAPMRNFLRDVVEGGESGHQYYAYFVTVREMVNIALAACDGREGNPGDYRDYRLKANRFRPGRNESPPYPVGPAVC